MATTRISSCVAIFFAACATTRTTAPVASPVAATPRAAPASEHPAAAPVEQDATRIPPQVAYDLAVTAHGTRVDDAADFALLGTVTLACLDRGEFAIVARDTTANVIYRNVVSAPPIEDIAVRPYSHVFSEILRLAWGICNPLRAIGNGEKRKASISGTFALGSFVFPDEVKISDDLGSVGCDAAPDDKVKNNMKKLRLKEKRKVRGTKAPIPFKPCTDTSPPQPFLSTLSRKK